MRLLHPPSLRALSTWLWALALLTLAAWTASSIRTRQAEAERREYTRLVAGTQQAMELWERRVLDAASGWLARIDEAPDMAALERRMREDADWIDAFYVWDTRSGEILFPRPLVPAADPASGACLARTESAGPVLGPAAQAAAYLACLPASPAMDTLLTERAARLLLLDGQGEAALRALQAGQTAPDLTIAEGRARGIPSARLIRWRLTAIGIARQQGDTARAAELAYALAGETAGLDGPMVDTLAEGALQELEDALVALLPEARRDPRIAELARARRRVEAWREVRDRVSLRADLPEPDETPSMQRDAYGTPPFLLLSRRLDSTERTAALQLDEAALVAGLLQVIVDGYGAQVQVSDGSGRIIAGIAPTSPSQRKLTFPEVFEYLRVSMPASRHEISPEERSRLLLSQFLPIALTVVLGGFALAARAAAMRGQLELESRRREFVTRVTHELKTPLAGIRVMAEAIEIGAFRSDDEREELAQRIVKESERLSQRVDEVLDMAREPRDFRREPTDLTALCEEVGARWRDLAEHAGIELRLAVEPLLTAVVERGMLRDALGALLDNAIKYRHPDRAAFIELHARSAGRRWVQFEVVDNGIGVPPAMRRAIFEPFTRVEGPGRGRAGGHGLGLSFVANAARVHRGDAECREGPEGGSRFILRVRRTP